MGYSPAPYSPNSKPIRPIYYQISSSNARKTLWKSVDVGDIPFYKPFTNFSCLVNENWIGLPPSSVCSMGPYNQEISGGSWVAKELKEKGYKANGVSILLKYPGGADAYFNDYVKPSLPIGLATYLLPGSLDALPWWNKDFKLPATVKSQLKAYTGQICLNVENFYPYALEFMVNEGEAYLGNYLNWFKQAMVEVRGYDVKESEVTDTYKKIVWPFYEKLIAAIRVICPKARIGFYNYPTMGPVRFTCPKPYGLAADLPKYNADLGWLWDLVDFLAPSHYPPYEVWEGPDDGQAPAGKVSYANYIWNWENVVDHYRPLADAHKKPLYMYVNLQMPKGTSILPRTGEAMFDIVNRVNPNALIVWGHTGFCNPNDPTVDRAIMESSFFNLAPFFKSFTYNPISI